MPSSILTVAGTAYNRAARATSRLRVNRLALGTSEPSELEFSEVRASLPGQFHPGQSVALSIDGTPRFLGQIVARHHRWDQDGLTVTYSAQGLKYLGNLIPIINPIDSSGTIIFNLPESDPDFSPSLAGQSVADILTYLFDSHAAALTAAGIAGYVVTDLTHDRLTVVPPEPVYFQGPHFFNGIDQFLDDWAAIFVCWVEWVAATSDWRIRVRNTLEFTARTITLGVDPAERPDLTRDSGPCYSRVRVIGRADVEGWYASTSHGTLTPNWTAQEEADWKWSDFSNPSGGVSEGAITALSSTQATLNPDDNDQAWLANFWSSNEGVVILINPVATGIEFTEVRRVTANSALTAGSTATVTFSFPLSNAGYTRYRLTAPISGDLDHVWREYRFTNEDGDDNTYVGQHLAPRFPFPTPFVGQGFVLLVNHPVFSIVQPDASQAEGPWPADLDLVEGIVRFREPVVKGVVANSQDDLDQGGSAVTPPADVKVFVPYSRGVLEAVWPPDIAGVPQYGGTSFTEDGIQRTWNIEIREWIDRADQARILEFARMMHDSVRDTIITGSLLYHGIYALGLDLGMALNVAADYGPGDPTVTGMETMAVPVREVELIWPPAGADNWTTRLSFSNRRKPATGANLYLPVPWQDAGGFGSLDASGLEESTALGFAIDGQSVLAGLPGTGDLFGALGNAFGSLNAAQSQVLGGIDAAQGQLFGGFQGTRDAALGNLFSTNQAGLDQIGPAPPAGPPDLGFIPTPPPPGRTLPDVDDRLRRPLEGRAVSLDDQINRTGQGGYRPIPGPDANTGPPAPVPNAPQIGRPRYQRSARLDPGPASNLRPTTVPDLVIPPPPPPEPPPPLARPVEISDDPLDGID